jgi:hypothetical protein
LRAEDRVDEAIALAEQAHAIHRDTGHRPGEARNYVVLSHARDRAGRPHWEQAPALFSDVGHDATDAVRGLLTGTQ